MSELPIRCFSPSYKRGHEKAIVQEAFPFVKMVVHECEAAAYKENGNDILVCPDSIRGNIARVRNWILDQNKDANVVMFDDDVKFIGVWQEQKFRKLNAEEAEELIETGFNLCDEWGYNMRGDARSTGRSKKNCSNLISSKRNGDRKLSAKTGVTTRLVCAAMTR